MGDIKNGEGQKKVDVIMSKVDKLLQQTSAVEARIASVVKEINERAADKDAIIKKLEEENREMKKDISYLSAQVESVYTSTSKIISALCAKVDQLKDVLSGQETPRVDCDELSSKVAEKIIIPVTDSAEIDYDAIAGKVAEKVSVVSPEIDYDALGIKVVQNMFIPKAVVEDIDYDAVAEKLASAIPAQEVVSADYIASKVAEQIVVPAQNGNGADVDIEELSSKIAAKIVVPAGEPVDVIVDEDRIAYAVAEKINAAKEGDIGQEAPEYEEIITTEIDEESLAAEIAAKLKDALKEELGGAAPQASAVTAIDTEEIADCVAKKVGTVTPDQFDVTVDEDGCDSIAKAITEKLDYDAISSLVAEKLAPVLMTSDNEYDAEELAKSLAEKIGDSVKIDEDAIAEKAASVLSNYLPEVDTDEIADRVVAGVVPSLPAAPAIDSDGIAESVSQKIVESQEDKDFDIVIDEDGIGKITECVSSEIKEQYNQRFDKVDEEIEEIKALLASGIIVSSELAPAVAEETAPEEETSEELVTVSDIVEDEDLSEDAEEVEAEETSDDVIGEIVNDIDESPADGEIMPDGIPGISNGVDFANMMKYNRSFIARIIQSSDDLKQYYGRVKNALLSYKKVNSNIAWGAERFNKGRETIARFKIRGKTLCLYLALDPNEYAVSVYHHADVSDNKSMNGTPMMVKIKSPLGAKKAIRLIDDMLAKRNGVKQHAAERDYAAMYPYETMEELIEEGLVKDVSKK